MAKEYFRLSTSGSINLIELDLPETIDTQEFDKINESMLTAVKAKARERWVIDLSNVSYMGSAMLGLMINIRQQIKGSGGKLVVCCLSDELREIFRTCSLERLFVIARTRPESMKLSGA